MSHHQRNGRIWGLSLAGAVVVAAATASAQFGGGGRFMEGGGMMGGGGMPPGAAVGGTAVQTVRIVDDQGRTLTNFGGGGPSFGGGFGGPWPPPEPVGTPVLGLAPPKQAAILAAPPEEADRFAETLATLESPMDIDVVELPLVEALAQIEKQHGLTFHLVRRALEDEGLDSESPVTLRVSKLRVGRVLTLLLEELDLIWVPRAGYVRITTRSAAEAELVTRIYPVADLVTVRTPAGEVRQAPDELLTVLTGQIDPDTWSDMGGPSSLMALDGGASLAATAPWPTQARIEEFLAAARAARTEVSTVLTGTEDRPAGAPSGRAPAGGASGLDPGPGGEVTSPLSSEFPGERGRP